METDTPKRPLLNVPAKDLPITPITLNEIDEEMRKRVSLVKHEMQRGFEFIKSQPKSVSIFGSARLPEDNEYYQKARRIGQRLAGLGYAVVTGGGPGVMEGANRGAFESNGISLGLNIKLPREQAANPYLTASEEFYYFFVRKVMLSFSAEAYLFFPGGFGTMDEFFEILTLVQTHKIERVPIFLVGSPFWNPLRDFIRTQMLETYRTIDEKDFDLFTVTDDEDAIVEAVKKVPVRDGVRFTYKKLANDPN